MGLHTKYRPKSLGRVKGNSNELAILEQLLSKKEKPKSYLLSGPTGCGKTTIARIIADRLKCHGADLIEMNSADFRGIDTIRDLYQKCQFKPIQSEARVWIVDECHQLTKDAQNAILKILEEPPTHVYFVLCTTDPEKLLPTIRGRCSHFQLTPLPESEMLSLLRRVVKLEKQELDDEVYDIIVRDSVGLPRNALQILEQVLSAPVEQRAKVAEKVAIEQSQVIELCRALLSGKNWNTIKKILTGVRDQEPESIRRIVLGYAQAVLLKSENDRAALIIEEFYEPTYNIGFPGVVYACYSITKN